MSEDLAAVQRAAYACVADHLARFRESASELALWEDHPELTEAEMDSATRLAGTIADTMRAALDVPPTSPFDLVALPRMPR